MSARELLGGVPRECDEGVSSDRTQTLGEQSGQSVPIAARIRVLNANARPATYRLSRGLCRIGAGEGVDILLDDKTVSRVHAELELVREGLRMVVENERGTGYKTVRLEDVTIAGKTGTAEVGGGKPDHAWFAGYVPADEPRYAFVVVLEHAGSGGRAAGPVAQRVVQSMLDVGLLRPNRLTLRERDAADEPGEPGD